MIRILLGIAALIAGLILFGITAVHGYTGEWGWTDVLIGYGAVFGWFWSAVGWFGRD